MGSEVGYLKARRNKFGTSRHDAADTYDVHVDHTLPVCNYEQIIPSDETQYNVRILEAT